MFQTVGPHMITVPDTTITESPMIHFFVGGSTYPGGTELDGYRRPSFDVAHGLVQVTTNEPRIEITSLELQKVVVLNPVELLITRSIGNIDTKVNAQTCTIWTSYSYLHTLVGTGDLKSRLGCNPDKPQVLRPFKKLLHKKFARQHPYDRFGLGFLKKKKL